MPRSFSRFCSFRTAAFVIAASIATAAAQPIPTAPPAQPVAGYRYDAEFFPGSKHDAGVPTPDSVLGFRVGDRPATHAQIQAVIRAIAGASKRTKLMDYGVTHQNKTLSVLAISSERNIARLDEIKADIAKFADPRRVSEAEGDRLASTLPAVAWMAYVIHGDELSGSDAALAYAYHLAASTDDDVVKMLDEVVVFIDPLMNPDGRDRTVLTIHDHRTAMPNIDDQSLIHTGVWPTGRMNHYLFDMNRDWIFATQPETRGRILAARDWHPQLFMESHEMGSQDTFLFSPPREAINHNIPANVRTWWPIFAKDQASSFDRLGWRYYTGEWNDEWYPGYTASWGNYRNAVGILYEQANVYSDGVRRQEGTIQTYRESVHTQVVSSVANVRTLWQNREKVMKDFLAERRRNVSDAGDARGPRTFAIVPGANAERTRRFVDLMQVQGFEVHSAKSAFNAAGKDRLGRPIASREFAPGTLLVSTRQPLSRQIAVMLEFDPRLPREFLTDERRELLRFGRSKMYDITGWSIPMLFDVEAYELAAALPGDAELLPEPAREMNRGNDVAMPPAGANPANADAAVAFVIDGDDDRSVFAAARLMERGIKVRASNKPTQLDGRDYSRGSLFILRKDNPDLSSANRQAGTAPGTLAGAIGEVATQLGLSATGVNSGLGPGDLPDLGGEHFVLLEQPRVAVLMREPFDPYSAGEIWSLIDHDMGIRASYIDSASLSGTDLRRYNVIIAPAGGDGSIAERMPSLKDWINAGGTFIAIGSSAAWAASEASGLVATRTLPDVLTKLDDHRQRIVREWEGLRAEADPEQVFAFTPPGDVVYPWMIGESGPTPSDDEAKRRDSWRSLFMPQGAVIAARLDDRHWLTTGDDDYVPVIFGGDEPLIATGGVEAPVRLGVFSPAPTKPAAESAPPTAGEKTPDANAEAKNAEEKKSDEKKPEPKPAPGWTIAPPGYEVRLRMSGLLWPEAADRITHTAYLTREGVGRGQVILFASSPTFRAATLGTTRLLTNAIVLGPGMGASTAIRP